MVEFCPKCGSLLMPSKDSSGTQLTCKKCGYSAGRESGSSQSYIIKETVRHSPRDKITVVEKDINTMPTTKVDCPKCHHTVAAYWQVQTRGADEGSTIFLRCLKCKHTWREY